MRNIVLTIWEWLRRHPSLAVALIVIGIGVQAFFEIAEKLPHGEFGTLDHELRELLLSDQSPALTLLARVVSDLLTFPYILILTMPFFGYLIYKRQYITAAGLLLIPNLSALLVEGLKRLFERPRPPVHLLLEQGYSFPSGHAFLSVVIYGLLGFIIWQCWARRQRERALVVVGVILFVLATGLSRVYLGVHYPSDVLAGWAAGTAVLAGSIALLEALEKRRD